jgi:DNA-binding PadR family transcriptional regulator
MSHQEPSPLRARLKPNQVYEGLNPKMKVALKILEHDELADEPAHFSGLVKEMQGVVSRATIHEALDSLLDQGIISAEWIETLKGRWARGYRSASEGQKRMLRRAYYATHD